ncbi:DNA methyltransferase [Campylobacter sp. MIT 21-1685]|uniref:DNA methyltransferase n=1 Tax=unclassified Campylobacter TaxID=2593542 RepID=UPI00224AE6AA|nr:MULTISPECIES: DNA methyltransferase [unclassified Campylobacter]MCX2682912.1 DNA methyltransferase [Campylobacter sp. MIT 21-1684]MCX2751140.1 DNA methyltransferase [Campylobacter sp. MIT 21-1682]MCX2807393.1 DNA methyltransferase [Campylobacter sp. MIT 21-1685]
MKSFDFSSLENKDFKEDSVREFILARLLQQLDFKPKVETSHRRLEIVLSQTLHFPSVIGSNKKIEAEDILTPDYVLYVDSKPHCVLDAKAPKVEINAQSKAERQAFYYAINSQIKAPFYALCNGKNFMLFETNGQNLLKEFDCEKLFANDFKNEHFALLKQYLSTPIESLKQTLTRDSKTPKKEDSWYLSRELPKGITKPQKQAKARYFGCTAYFTRQSWDIVTQNIKNFTDTGDVVLDPFGGSGVTAIEAMMNGRLGIHTDLNPLSIFMVKALSAKVDLSAMLDISEEILSEFESIKPKSEKEAKQILKNARYYPNVLSDEFAIDANMGGGDCLFEATK